MSDTPRRHVEAPKTPRNDGVDPAVRAQRLENRNSGAADAEARRPSESPGAGAAAAESRRALERRRETNPKMNETFNNLLALQARVPPEEFARFLNQNERVLVKELSPFYQGCASTPEGTLKQFGAAVDQWSKVRQEADSKPAVDVPKPPSDAYNRLVMWKTAGEYPLAAPSIVLGHVIGETVGEKLGFEQDPVKATASGKTISEVAKLGQALKVGIDGVSAKDLGKRIPADKLKVPEVKRYGATNTNPDPNLLRLARDVRATQAGVSRQAFRDYNVATAKVRVDGKVMYLDSGNFPGGLHSEEWLHTQVHKLGKEVVVEQVYTERIPCKDICRPLLSDERYRHTQIFYTTHATGANRARELMKAYGVSGK